MSKSNAVLSMILYTVFVFIWAAIGLMGLFSSVESGLSNVFGGVLIRIGAIVGLIFFFAPWYLKKFIKKDEWVIAAASIGMAVIYALIGVIAMSSTEAYLSRFTTNKWVSYPTQRYKMIDDLKKSYNIIGLEETEIIPLLGEPLIKNDLAYVYFPIGPKMTDTRSYEIYIKDGKITETRQYVGIRREMYPE